MTIVDKLNRNICIEDVYTYMCMIYVCGLTYEVYVSPEVWRQALDQNGRS